MKTINTILSFIAIFMMVSCDKDNSYEGIEKYHISKIIYSFDGKTVAEVIPARKEWDNLQDWYWRYDEIWFFDNKVYVKGRNIRGGGTFYIDKACLIYINIGSLFYTFKIKKKGGNMDICYYPYFEHYTLGSDFEPIYDEGPVNFESLEKVDNYNGTDIFDTPYHGYLYSNDGKPVSCEQYQGDFWYDRIDYCYKKE